jgi:hypothetical protein
MEMLEREAKQATAGIREDGSGDLQRMEFWSFAGGTFLGRVFWRGSCLACC